MKKLLRTLLLAAALTALLCVSALAADSAVSNVTGNILTPKTAEGAEITADTNGKYENAVKFDVNATGTKGSQYLLLVLRDQNVPTEQNIVYINQAAAGEDGKLVFTNAGGDSIYPMDLVNGTYSIYILGDGKTFVPAKADASFTYDAGYTLGDVNNDTEITVSDAVMVLNHVAKNIVLTRDYEVRPGIFYNAYDAANVAKSDEDITISDALRILNYVAKNISSFD